MSRPSTLSMLIDMRRRERDRIAGQAAQAQRDRDAAASTLRTLSSYQEDYRQRSPKNARQSTDTGAVRVHETFVGKLGHAIGQQDALTRTLDDRHRQQLVALAEGERRLKALETLVQRREAARRRRQESLEQKQTDEFAAQAHARTTSGSSGHD